MCNPHECSNAKLGNDDWQKGPCGQNPRELTDEIERLQAIVGKLPKTADGVPVVPGMRVYWLYPTERSGGNEFCCARACVRYVESMAPSDCRSMFCFPILVETDNGKPALRDCYSTKAAAEAAKEKAMTRDLTQLTRSTVKILRATELDQLPDDGTESFGVALEHVVLYQADEIERLQGIVSKTEQWASYLHSCAMSGELPLTREDFDDHQAAAQAAGKE